MEDVKLGRQTQPDIQANTLSTASKRILLGNGARWGITFCPPSSGVVWFQPGPLATAGQGYCLQAGDLPLQLNLTSHGQQVVMEWSAVADAGAPIMVVIGTRLLRGSGEAISDY